MSGNIVWLAAYPKTGSTWVRTIVHLLVAPKAPRGLVIPSFKNERPMGAMCHEVMDTQARLFRTHSHPEHRAFRTHARRQADQVIGVITVKRHPLDVLLSQLNYSCSFGRAEHFIGGVAKPVEQIVADGEIDHYIDMFIEADGWPGYAKRSISYAGFYDSWKNYAPGARQLDLRYEDMIAKPRSAIKKIARFLERDHDVDAVMRRVEKWSRIDGKFFWRKRAYNFRSLLPERSIARFERGFADSLRDLGYTDEPCAAAVQGLPAQA